MTIKRRIVSWEEVERDPEWYATLECGHTTPGPYDDVGMSDSQKAAAEKAGEVACVECSRIEDDIAKAEKALEQQKARRKVTP